MTKTLTMALKAVYFDQIKSGEKTAEFRLVTAYWRKRLVNREYEEVVLTCAYPKDGGIEGVTRLTRKWRGFTIQSLTHPHFGPDPVDVFAIDVSQPA